MGRSCFGASMPAMGTKYRSEFVAFLSSWVGSEAFDVVVDKECRVGCKTDSEVVIRGGEEG